MAGDCSSRIARQAMARLTLLRAPVSLTWQPRRSEIPQHCELSLLLKCCPIHAPLVELRARFS